jgi:membrane associated rhomboid family serine protease
MGGKINAIGGLIGTNILLFLLSVVSRDSETTMFNTIALYFPLNPNFGVWQLFTNMFMHASFTHILFNMYALWAFGTPLLKMWGDKRFLMFYLLAGVGASLIYTVVNYIEFSTLSSELTKMGITPAEIQHFLQNGQSSVENTAIDATQSLRKLYHLYRVPAVGASGAIYGVLVAFGLSFPNAKLALLFFPVPIAAKYFIPVLLALDLFSGVTGFSIFGGGIAHFAHIGGAVIGFLLMWFWRSRSNRTAGY